jgi:WD40 repeat protein
MKRSLVLAVLSCALCVLNACGGGGNDGGEGGGGGSHVATHFSVTAPATAAVSTFFGITVVALDASNNPVTGYSGTVHLASSDPQAVLSGDSTLTSGTELVSASLTSLGSQTITATDTATASITGSSNAIEVAANSNVHGFHPTGDMETERSEHTATLLADGRVLITGGYNTTNGLATAELYDPATGIFTPTGTMTTSRFLHTATLLAHGPAATNGKVLITGGSNSSGDSGSNASSALGTAEIFDPATGTFTATGTMKDMRFEHTATLLANGKVLVAGGTADNVAELYDPATGSFTSTGVLMLWGGRWGCTATLLNDGTVLIAGGRDDEDVFDGSPINTAEQFNPVTGIFTATGEMTAFRYGHTAALLNNGKVLLTGGFNGTPLQSAELFDPTTGTFSPTGPMGSTRADHTATLLDDGTVLVAGGFAFPAGPGGFATADVFDSATTMFTVTGRLGIDRYTHTATHLNNGQVLITGGQSDSNRVFVIVRSAELYK